MPLIQLVIVLVVVGLILWVINSYIPMQATIKKILNVVVVIAVVIWLLSVFGLHRITSQQFVLGSEAPENTLKGVINEKNMDDWTAGVFVFCKGDSGTSIIGCRSASVHRLAAHIRCKQNESLGWLRHCRQSSPFNFL